MDEQTWLLLALVVLLLSIFVIIANLSLKNYFPKVKLRNELLTIWAIFTKQRFPPTIETKKQSLR